MVLQVLYQAVNLLKLLWTSYHGSRHHLSRPYLSRHHLSRQLTRHYYGRIRSMGFGAII